MSYVKFWLAKQLAELLWVLGIIATVFLVICVIAFCQAVRDKFRAWRRVAPETKEKAQ